MTTPTTDYLTRCREILDCVAAQQPAIEQAADWFAESILADRMVHLFAGGEV